MKDLSFKKAFLIVAGATLGYEVVTTLLSIIFHLLGKWEFSYNTFVN
jgi:hypothetical protein